MSASAYESSHRISTIRCETAQGTELHATPLRLGEHAVVFEVYNPSVIRLSERLPDFKVFIDGSLLYSGKAVVTNLVSTGTQIICEATLNDSWAKAGLAAKSGHASWQH